MPLTLAQLSQGRTKDQFRAQLIAALQGIYHTSHTKGFGPGTLSILPDPVPGGNLTMVVKITTSGEPGVAGYAVSSDGGNTFGVPQTMPVSSATYVSFNAAIANGINTGVKVAFAQGPSGTYNSASPSFVAGDLYQFLLNTPNFPTDNWQPGSVPLGIIDADSDTNTDLWETVQAYVDGAFISTASGPFLDAAATFYGETRLPGVATQGTVNVNDGGGNGPSVILPGQMVIGTQTGLRYVNAATINLPQGAGTGSIPTVPATFVAESVGDAYNVGNGSITVTITALAGVTVNNPALTNGSWITTYGSNQESDDKLKARCLAKWPQLAALPINYTSSAIDALCKAALNTVTRTQVKASSSPGFIDIYLGGATAPISGSGLTTVSNKVNGVMGICIVAVAHSAVPIGFTIVATIQVLAAYTAQINAQIVTALNTYFAGLPIGPTCTVVFSELVALIQDLPGVVSVNMTSPAMDYTLADTQMPTLNIVFDGAHINVVSV
jgi:uncharacterized phage protein gp47/JayE